jgi:hypothetical protein
VAIVSDEPAGQQNRLGSQGPLDSWSGLTFWVPLGRKTATDKTPRTEIATVTVYKRTQIRSRRWPLPEAGLKPYWGKPTVRNFRGGGGNGVDGPMTICHNARKGGHIGSHWPNHLRASALLGGYLFLFGLFIRGAKKNSPQRPYSFA